MTGDETLKPIQAKVENWIQYNKNYPKGKYEDNPKCFDGYRSKNDMDCKLTNGNLFADTIISLSLPMRFVLRKLHGYDIEIPSKTSSKYIDFLEELKSDLGSYFPTNSLIVQKLSNLFELGMTRANVMNLPSRDLQQRGLAPYYDYMPYFLLECFQGGNFNKAFGNDEELKRWIEEQHLKMFFLNEDIEKDKILDLSGSGVKNNIPKNVDIMIDNYIDILEKRKVYY